MPKPGDRIVVHMVEPAPVGLRFERRRLEWPLHITLAVWFSKAVELDLKNGLAQIAETTAPFRVTVGPETKFGNTPVNLITEQELIRPLYSMIHTVIEDAEGEFENERFRFNAHITHHGDRRRHEGDVEFINDFHLVRLLPDNICEVEQRFALEAGSEAAA